MNKIFLLHMWSDLAKVLANHFRIGGKQNHLMFALHKMVQDAFSMLDIEPPKRRVNDHGEATARYRRNGRNQSLGEDLLFTSRKVEPAQINAICVQKLHITIFIDRDAFHEVLFMGH